VSVCRGSNLFVYLRNDGSNVAGNVGIDVTYPNGTTFNSQCSMSQINAGGTNSTICPISSPVLIGTYRVRASGGGSVASGGIYCSSGIGVIGGGSNPTTTTTAGGGPSGGLEAYWKFDEDTGSSASDSSGNGHTGTLSSPTLWDKKGHTNTAIAFPGAGSEYVDVVNFGAFTTFSVTAWVNRTGATATREDIVSYKEIACGFILLANNDGVNQYPGVYVDVTGGWQFVQQTSSIPLYQWTHLAATYDGTTITLYVNAVPVAFVPAPGTMIQCTRGIRIGNIEGGSTNFEFPGKIDEVRIFNKALTQAEIASIMAAS
jgi:hypothetical protein